MAQLVLLQLREQVWRGVLLVQSFLPSRRPAPPSQAASAQWLSLALITALLYLCASATLAAFWAPTAAAAPKREAGAAGPGTAAPQPEWARGLRRSAAALVRTYAQASFALLSIALLVEAPPAAYRAGLALASAHAGARAPPLPPPRLVWLWTLAAFCAVNDLALGFVGALRAVTRLAACARPAATQRSTAFLLCEAVGELGLATDLLVTRIGLAGTVLVLATVTGR